MSIRSINATTVTNDTTTSLAQTPRVTPQQERQSNSFHLVASFVLTGALAFGGGLGFAAAQDFVEDGRLTVLIREME